MAASAGAGKSNSDAELAKAVVSAEDDETSQESGFDTNAAATTNGPVVADTGNIQWNATESSSGPGAVNIPKPEDDLESKLENAAVRIKILLDGSFLKVVLGFYWTQGINFHQRMLPWEQLY